MDILPFDMLLEIMKYLPKNMSLTCRSLRKQFNIYDHWVINRDTESKYKPLLDRIYDFFMQRETSPSPLKDYDKIKFLKVSKDIELIKKCHNLEELQMNDIYLHGFSLNNIPNLGYLKKIYLSTATDTRIEPDGYLLKDIIECNNKIEIYVDNFWLNFPFNVQNIEYKNIRIKTIIVSYGLIPTTLLDSFMENINCPIMNIDSHPLLYASLSTYTNNKPGKKVVVDIFYDDLSALEQYKNFAIDWVEINVIHYNFRYAFRSSYHK